MNSFALADCTTVEAALSQLKDGAVVKAGGVDLLDRMKNGTDSPARLVNIRNISELRGIQATPAGPHHRRAHHARRNRRRPHHPFAVHGLVRRLRARRHAAHPQYGNPRRQSPSGVAVLVFPLRRFPVPSQRQRHLFCLLRLESVPRHHGLRWLSFRCAILWSGRVARSGCQR